MAPSAEMTMETASIEELTPRKNVASAVNYELSMVDQFLASEQKRRVTGPVQPVGESTCQNSATKSNSAETTFQGHSNIENGAPNVQSDAKSEGFSSGAEERVVKFETPKQDESTRRSAREKQTRSATLARNRVRYDMQLVPPARRHRAFIQTFPTWWMSPTEAEKPRRSSRLVPTSKEDTIACEVCDGTTSNVLFPFSEDTSVLWVPTKRSEWEDSVSEMTAVCTAAAIRHHKSTLTDGAMNKPFHAPLSRDYIRDRVDIDDPLNGYQLRHKVGGWLQGFIMWTNFTTWTHYFKWDSRHPLSGFANGSTSKLADSDGSLADELESQPRSGDPHGGGVVFPAIAEISLVGGLGCGEYMLRMALDSIREKRQYKYVVLQATDSSKTFYERFGFIRVGAVCRYGSGPVPPTLTLPIVGYRHWTHANESETSLQMHGGPSYMMCLKLPEAGDCPSCGRSPAESKVPTPFLDEMLKLAVDSKPTIEQLGATSTPGPKPARRGSTMSVGNESLIFGDASAKKKPGRRPAGFQRTTVKRKNSVDASSGDDLKETKSPGPKRRKIIKEAPQKAAPSTTKPAPPFRRPILPRSPKLVPVDKVIEQTFGSHAAPDTSFSADVPAMEPIPLPPAIMDAAAAAETQSSLGSNTTGKPVPIDKATLLKQKVKSYPRSRVHYYNRVVKQSSPGNNNDDKTYYFVLHYDESSGLIRIAPMQARGRLTGKREGRPRFQVVLEDTDANILSVPGSDYEVVKAVMVMKTPVIAQEAWDIEDE